VTRTRSCERGKTTESDENSHDSPTLLKFDQSSVPSTGFSSSAVLCLCGRCEVYVLTTMVVFSKHLNSLDSKQTRPLLPLLFAVLLFRSRLITGPRDAFTALKKAAGIQKPTPEELEQARQQLYRKNPDGTKDLLITYRDRISEVSPLTVRYPIP